MKTDLNYTCQHMQIIIIIIIIIMLIKKINAKRLAQRFDIVEMSLSNEKINYKPHISTKIVE